jgi:membrane protein
VQEVQSPTQAGADAAIGATEPILTLAKVSIIRDLRHPGFRAGQAVQIIRYCYRVAMDAFYRFNANDGWATASHIALSALMSLFPFLIVVTALAGFLGTKELADEVAQILLETWPSQVATPIAKEIHHVLTTTRGDVLTIGVALAIYFASSGIESVRIGLNRAYGLTEHRRWWLLRLESIAYVVVAAIALLVLAFLVVLAPLIFATAVQYLPWLAPLVPLLNFLRIAVAAIVLIVALLIAHKWLPAGRRRLVEIAPGIAATMILWLVAGEMFGSYLADFAYTYVTYYAGLASAMIALVFLYLTASIFIYGGELNTALVQAREAVAED